MTSTSPSASGACYKSCCAFSTHDDASSFPGSFFTASTVIPFLSLDETSPLMTSTEKATKIDFYLAEIYYS